MLLLPLLPVTRPQQTPLCYLLVAAAAAAHQGFAGRVQGREASWKARQLRQQPAHPLRYQCQLHHLAALLQTVLLLQTWIGGLAAAAAVAV
jgi:hypothetical protein